MVKGMGTMSGFYAVRYKGEVRITENECWYAGMAAQSTFGFVDPEMECKALSAPTALDEIDSPEGWEHPVPVKDEWL